MGAASAGTNAAPGLALEVDVTFFTGFQAGNSAFKAATEVILNLWLKIFFRSKVSSSMPIVGFSFWLDRVNINIARKQYKFFPFFEGFSTFMHLVNCFNVSFENTFEESTVDLIHHFFQEIIRNVPGYSTLLFYHSLPKILA